MISGIASAASANSSSPSTRGIELRSFAEAHIFYNTVLLNYAATDPGNSSASLYVNNDDDTVVLNNNIFINLTMLSLGANGVATAFYKDDATLSNMMPATSNNLYYCGEPSNSNPIFYAYSSSSPLIGQTLGDYQVLAGNFDQVAFTGDVDFISSTDLHVQSTDIFVRENAISIESPITISEDIDGQTRNAINPDLGADELPEFFPLAAVNPIPIDLSKTVL